MLLPLPVKAQKDCLDFINQKSSENEVQVVVVRTLEKKNEAYLENVKILLKSELQREMSEKILVSVKSSVVNDQSESNNKFYSYFNSQIDIKSSSNIGLGVVEFCVDRGEKKIYGKYTIDKIQLAKSNYQDCINNLKALNNELSAVIQSSNRLDVGIFKRRLEELNSQLRTSIYLNPDLVFVEYDELNRSCNSMISRLMSSQSQQWYDSEMLLIKDSLKVESYFFAISHLRALQKQYRSNVEIEKEIELAEKDYRSQVFRKLSLFESNLYYKQALEVIDTYCKLLPLDELLREKKMELRVKLFEQITKKYYSSIDIGKDSEVQYLKKQLDELQDVDMKEYSEILKSYSEYERKKVLSETLRLFHQRKFQESYQMILAIESSFGKNYNEINRMKRKVVRKLVTIDVQELKRNRPMVYCFQFGAELHSNFSAFDSVSNYKLINFSPAYSFGIYRKYNFDKYEKREKVSRYKSDFIGLKVTYIDFHSNFRYFNDSIVANSVAFPQRFNMEFSLEGNSFRVFHYGIGGVLDELAVKNLDFNSLNLYFGTLGFRIPVGKFSWVTDATLKTDFNGSSSFNFRTGLFFRLDYRRKFNRSDRIEIKSKWN